MRYKVVQVVDNRLTATEYEDVAACIVAMEEKGFEFRGVNDNPRQRKELQGCPQFRGLLGPMWDGDKIRYEDKAAYDILST